MSTLYSGRRVLWMPLQVGWAPPSSSAVLCCEAMAAALDFACDQHEDPFACADGLVVYNEIFDEYGLAIHDGGASYVLITHCPWCGGRLPDSQRDRWFEAVESLQLAEGVDPPPRFLTGAWRR